MTKSEKNLRVVSYSITDDAAPGEALRLDEPWQRELARDLEWHYRPPYVVAGDGE